jgi:hypothetical protein
MMGYSFDETLERILSIFHDDTALFVIIETLVEDNVEIDEYLEDNK